ncbi:hypothetical protein Tco_1398190, partial [Tanacetum coccineum]
MVTSYSSSQSPPNKTLKVEDHEELADMASTTIPIELMTSYSSSPDARLLHENKYDPAVVTDSNRGFETIITYPYRRLKRNHTQWSDHEAYKARGHIRDRLKPNFLGKGPKYRVSETFNLINFVSLGKGLTKFTRLK